MKSPDVEYFVLQDIRTQRVTSVDPRFLFTRRVCFLSCFIFLIFPLKKLTLFLLDFCLLLSSFSIPGRNDPSIYSTALFEEISMICYSGDAVL